MRSTVRQALWFASLVCAVPLIASCNALGITHPVSNDGACSTTNNTCLNSTTCVVGSATNPCATPGSNILSLVPSNGSLTVGGSTSITATYGGRTLTGFTTGPLIPTTFSDSSVIWGSAYGVSALQVGTATLTASYNGSQTTVSFIVQPSASGASAEVFMCEGPACGTEPVWVPAATTVHAGWFVQFVPLINHNVVFDPVPGAPPGLGFATNNGAGAVRLFSTAGTFPFHCTMHGEAGVITVVSP